MTDAEYRLQREWGGAQQERLGEVVGFKIALTSAASRQALQVEAPLYGRIHRHRLDSSPATLAHIPGSSLELEIAITRSAAGALGAHAAFEVVQIGRSPVVPGSTPAGSFVADNAAFVWAVVAETALPVQLEPDELATLHGRIESDGDTVAEGAFADVYGGPMAAYRWLVDELDSRGETIGGMPASQSELVVLTGSCSTPLPVSPTPVGAHTTYRGVISSAARGDLGSVQLIFTGLERA